MWPSRLMLCTHSRYSRIPNSICRILRRRNLVLRLSHRIPTHILLWSWPTHKWNEQMGYFHASNTHSRAMHEKSTGLPSSRVDTRMVQSSQTTYSAVLLGDCIVQQFIDKWSINASQSVMSIFVTPWTGHFIFICFPKLYHTKQDTIMTTILARCPYGKKTHIKRVLGQMQVKRGPRDRHVCPHWNQTGLNVVQTNINNDAFFM